VRGRTSNDKTQSRQNFNRQNFGQTKLRITKTLSRQYFDRPKLRPKKKAAFSILSLYQTKKNVIQRRHSEKWSTREVIRWSSDWVMSKWNDGTINRREWSTPGGWATCDLSNDLVVDKVKYGVNWYGQLITTVYWSTQCDQMINTELSTDEQQLINTVINIDDQSVINIDDQSPCWSFSRLIIPLSSSFLITLQVDHSPLFHKHILV